MNGNYEKFKSPVDKVTDSVISKLKPGEKADMIMINQVLDEKNITGENRGKIAIEVGDELYGKGKYHSFTNQKPSDTNKQASHNAYERRDHLLET